MRQRISPRFSGRSSKLAACLLAALAAAGGARPAAACAGGPECEEIQCDSLFSPEIIGDPAAEPFFYSDVGFADQNRDMVEENRATLESANLEEWSHYFDSKISTTALSFLLYKMSLPDLDELVASLRGKDASSSASARALRESLSKSGPGAAKALEYLSLAKHVEPLATWRDGRSEWEAKDGVAASTSVAAPAAALIEEAQKASTAASDPFLERRYRFQILRLLFYSDDYKECLAYYEANQAAFEAGGSIRYRAMDLAAGSLYRLKDYSRADYLYALIFDAYPPLRRSAFQSFHPQEEADWQRTLAMARGVQEKTALWELFGLYADGAAAMEKIHALDPGSPRLPLLLVHEVNKAEADAGFTRGRVPADAPAPPRVSPALLAVVRKIADAGDADKPAVWHAALGQLLAMDGDSNDSLARLDVAMKSAKGDPRVETQARMTRLFAKVRGLSDPEEGPSSYFAAELRWLETSPNSRAGFLLDWSLNALSAVYKSAGDGVRSMMLADDPAAPLYQDNASIDRFIAFLRRPSKTDFDRYLAGHYGYTVDQLLELKAINDLYAGRYKEASRTLGKAAGAVKLKADPFADRIADCHDCDFEAPKKTAYTKASFLRRLDALASRAGGSGEDAARASLELGNALYNITWFGDARDAYATERGNFPDGLPSHLDMAPAANDYARALALSGNREFKAKAAFMAAKAEHNALFAAFAGRDAYKLENYVETKGIPAGKAYELLKGSYSDTKYYSEIIAECGWFERWTAGDKP